MKIFNIHSQIIEDYKSFIHSFINIRDSKINEKVVSELSSGKLWPDPLIQFNPNYEDGDSINELINNKILHSDFLNILPDYKLYKHQSEAIRLGATNENFIVTSGTGSGKSLTFIATIFNYILNNNVGSGRIKAIIVYPMNALINSQIGEFNGYRDNYEKATKKDFPIKYKKYTGQEKQDEREEILRNPPHILLTNYMMLELILTRSREYGLRNSIFENLRFLVFDELHTYRGRQGADVGMLIKRIKSQCQTQLVFIGTSATMSSLEDNSRQKKVVADFAGKFFGTAFSENQVISETLKKIFPANDNLSKDVLTKSLEASVLPDKDETYLLAHPLSSWIEETVILDKQNSGYNRSKPKTVEQIVNDLSLFTGKEHSVCRQRLLELLDLAENVNFQLSQKGIRNSYLPYKIHQFINQTGSVHVSLLPKDDRIISLDAKSKTMPSEGNLPLYQVVFSRITGQEFICVKRDINEQRLLPRIFRYSDIDEDSDWEEGYIYFDKQGEEPLWDLNRDIESLPDYWIKINKKEEISVKKEKQNFLPVKLYVRNDGAYAEHPGEGYHEANYISSDSPLDPSSGTVYDTRTNEGTMYTSLGNEGRSTATNIVAFSIIKYFERGGFNPKKQKLLSFTDNRQDTALQSGHFNDFIKVGQLRSAIYHALAEYQTLDYTTINDKVFDQLNIEIDDYVQKPVDQQSHQYMVNVEALKNAIMYKILYDLRRGWRVILPNLEQCALLNIKYIDLEEEVNKDKWRQFDVISKMPNEEKYDFFYQILDYFRKSNATGFSILSPNEIEQNYIKFKENLKPSWLYSPDEKIQYPYYFRVISPKRNKKTIYHTSIGSRSAIGRYIKKVCKQYGLEIKGQDYDQFVTQMLNELVRSGFLVKREDILDVPLYQLNGIYIQWCKGDEKQLNLDKIKNPSYKSISPKINVYFREFYKTTFSKNKRIEAGEHSGQLKNEARIDYEEKFREGRISLLCCSPTMELGIDISDLSAVHMRNVPPNPANYAQRSGRAGRSGQAALIFTYCSNYSAHDQHYFDKNIEMVSGIVSAPRLDFTNEELIRTHLHSLYLSEAGIDDLHISLADLVIEIPGADFLQIKPEVYEKLRLSENQISKLKRIFEKISGELMVEPRVKEWLNDNWVNRMIKDAPELFNGKLERWRNLYKLASAQILKANKIDEDVTIPSSDERKIRAKREKYLAQKQIDQLRLKQVQGVAASSELSEFYPYRYFASEGFLPGYNFTRLPVRVFIPHKEGQYISRPRFLAIREFGPFNRVYYMGAKFQVKQMPVSDLLNNLRKAKVVKEYGYILFDEDYERNVCPFSIQVLDNDNKRAIFHNLVEICDSRSEEQGRITCEEEERISRGFDIQTYFSLKGYLDKIERVDASIDDEELLHIRYLPAATLYKINVKWRTTDREGFPIGVNSGYWKKPSKEISPDSTDEQTHDIKLFTSDTADALYIEPVRKLNLKPEGVITLLYALKRGIEQEFQAESNEIGAEVMGNPFQPNIMIYEASEGSLGIMRQIARNISLFKKVVESAYEICHFNKSEEEQKKFGVASYRDLLSYYNQFYHQDIDRTKIKDALINLMNAKYGIVKNPLFRDYDEQYQRLKMQVDLKSSTEIVFLDYLYKNNLRLPDKAQADMIKPCGTIPDFIYEDTVKVCLYCDGSHHDDEHRKRFDEQRRKCLQNMGYEVLVWHYLTPIDEFIATRKDIFTKMR